ncbi:MAG: LCP family protein [Oscillospiraceae bacterium]|nr:LCP family protein [Oscillospiraceae bacterium]
MAKNHTKAKKGGLAGKLLAAALVVGAVVFCATTYVNGMFNQGEQIDEDIRTAEELKDKVVNILVCGIDYTEGRDFGNTDVMLYVTLDVEGGKVAALQIPRDTYIGDDIKTGGSKKVNGVYGHGSDSNKIMNLVKAVNSKLGLSVDHYVTLDMDALIKMVDWIDWGFEMYVPYPVIMVDKATGNKHTLIEEPGWHQVNGEMVEAIVRNRNYPGGDSARLEVQNYFYASLVKNFMENLNVSDFIKVLPRFTQYITTDLDLGRIASLAQFGFSVDYNNMSLIKPAVHGYNVIYDGNTYETNILVAEKTEWADILNTHFRPYQDAVSADELKIPGTVPSGEVTRDWGVVASTYRTIGGILAGTGSAEETPAQ